MAFHASAALEEEEQTGGNPGSGDPRRIPAFLVGFLHPLAMSPL
jgi:hypothetical protein